LAGYDRHVGEPKAVAQSVEEVVSGVWCWHVADDRIGGHVSSAHAVHAEDGVVLIDPLPLEIEALISLGDVTAICLTTSSHQRSAWRLRRELGVHVWAPAASKEVEEDPDERYGEGDALPGGLEPLFTPGAGTTQHSLLLDRDGGVLFTPDLFVRPEGEPLALIPAEYAHDPGQSRLTAERLLELDFAVLCTGHGLPVTDDPKSAIRTALAG
jgi:glyoxylase-like metal-dependent hydrolase (beta-lactamase superfamily II)